MQVVLNIYVKPSVPVVSYLTALTSLNEGIINAHGQTLEVALQILRIHLPKYAVLVGQNIGKDVQWLGLKEGADFESLIDLVGRSGL